MINIGNYAEIREYDVANGKGIRVSVFLTGCTHNCKSCFNADVQDFKSGKEWTDAETELVIKYLQSPNVSGFSLLGGEPFQNLWFTKHLKKIRESLRDNQDIWVWSGYTLEELLKNEQRKEMLELCDVLVDGKFVEELKDLKLEFRGSSNQRIIELTTEIIK